MAQQKIAVVAVLVILIGAYFGALAIAGYYDLKERQKRGEPPRFDERQRISRLRAGNHALLALVMFLIVWAVVDWTGLFEQTKDVWSMVLSALLLAWGVWAVDCVLHDGFIGWKQRDASNTFALTTTVCMLPIVRPDLTGSWVPFLMLCLVALALSAAVFYKHRLEKRAAQLEEGGE